MLHDQLKKAALPLEDVGFKIEDAYPRVSATSERHELNMYFQDPQSFIVIDVGLIGLPECRIDAYSAIKYFAPEALRRFIESGAVLTTAGITSFLIQQLVTDCARVFRVIDRAQWLELYAFHHESLRRRNESFWAAVSGYRDQYPFKSRRKYTQEPKPTW